VNLANALRLPGKKEMTIWSLEQGADMLVVLIIAMLMAWTQLEKDFGVVQRLRAALSCPEWERVLPESMMSEGHCDLLVWW
jgi:hypothetical protein